MNRLNGRVPGNHTASDYERDPELEPSCLVRTPSGNFYNIPSKNSYNPLIKNTQPYHLDKYQKLYYKSIPEAISQIIYDI